MKTFRAKKPAANQRPGTRNSQGIFSGGIFRLVYRIAKLLVISFLYWEAYSWVLLYRYVNPPITYLMVQRGFERKAAGKEWKIDKQWMSFDSISDPMKRAAVAAEDQKFLDHFGFRF